MLIKTVLNGLYYTKVDEMLAPYTQGIAGIWMLHRTNDNIPTAFSPNAHLSVSPDFLDMAILQFKLRGFEFVTLDEIVQRISSGAHQSENSKLIAITLDDAYVDNYHNAVPVFRRHSVPYSIFVSPGLVDGDHSLWWEDLEQIIASTRTVTLGFEGESVSFDTSDPKKKSDVFSELLRTLSQEVGEDRQREIIAALSDTYAYDAIEHVQSEIMSWDQLAELSQDALCTLGAHTMGHFAVARLDEDRAQQEMSDSKVRLEEFTGKNVDHFAFPYGYESAAGERDFKIAREVGFKSAVTTRHGMIYANGEDNPFALPRISINGDFQSLRYLRPLMSGVPAQLYKLGNALKVA